MSRDTKTSYIDCQERVETSFVPSTSLFPVHHAKRDESNESNDHQRSARLVTRSIATTYASDTDGWFEKDLILELLAFGLYTRKNYIHVNSKI